MMPGSKNLKAVCACTKKHKPAYSWQKTLTPARYEHESEVLTSRYANIGQECVSAQHGTLRWHHTTDTM